MQDNSSDETTDADRMREWLNAVGGGVSLGQSKVKAVKISKSGDKLTIVLKKKKAKQPIDQP